jgi:preprotein translocase subunit SecE
LVERRSPKPEVVGSSPSAPAKLINFMKNPFKFIQEVKQETFRITWPTKKDTMMGAVMVFALASIAAIFFLILDQILRFLLNLVLTINF